MDDSEIAQQQRIHDVIEDVLRESDDLKEGHFLTGWIVCYETTSLSENASAFAGSFYGPREMSTWRALGLVEWVRRFSLKPDDSEDGEEDD